MTYEATLKVSFDTKFANHSSYGIYDDETLPEEHYTFEIPADDLNTIQLFRFFGTVARTMGHNEIGIMKGACSLVFNDMRSQEDMKKIADEYDLKLSEDHMDIVMELQKEILDLKAKLSRALNPDNPNYTDAEMNAMTAENEVTADTLRDADVVCGDCGQRWGKYSVGCSSFWKGTCNVCGQEKSITEVRDFGYLQKGIQELSK